jgi:hypothetical protein
MTSYFKALFFGPEMLAEHHSPVSRSTCTKGSNTSRDKNRPQRREGGTRDIIDRQRQKTRESFVVDRERERDRSKTSRRVPKGKSSWEGGGGGEEHCGGCFAIRGDALVAVSTSFSLIPSPRPPPTRPAVPPPPLPPNPPPPA